MHTATRLADEVVVEIDRARPDLPVALYGLYAGVGSADVDARLEGEYEPGLIEWSSGAAVGRRRHIGRSEFSVPDRDGMAPLGEYAHLENAPLPGPSTVLAGAVEASHGCRHRCRHCPIPAVYDGRMRIVPRSQVLADISNLVSAGARHVTFADPDFLNAPAHSLAILERAHADHPEITFDATVKVQHILEQRDIWPKLAGMNLIFVVSAFESVDPRTLEILDKGHTVEGMAAAIDIMRSTGIHVRPTWLPFLPWTTTGDVAGIFEFVERHELAGCVDPVQMSIRLLIPKGSLLESHPAVVPHLRRYDSTNLTWAWDFAHPETADLHKDLEAIAAGASDCGQDAVMTLNEMSEAVSRVHGRPLRPFEDGAVVPRLSESWFCCAEPTHRQSVSIGIGRSR
jgi:hypothetical protein